VNLRKEWANAVVRLPSSVPMSISRRRDALVRSTPQT
jgi:hypothetical protein